MNTSITIGSHICDRFIINARSTPYSIAISDKKGTFTYAKLHSLARSLAHIITHNVFPGEPIVILGSREMETPLAMIASLIAGVPFAVIDSSYPHDRIAAICDQLKAQVALYSPSLDRIVDSAMLRRRMNIREWIRIDQTDPARQGIFPDPLNNNTAYIIFTSGSTGHPKGIRTGHEPLIHFAHWYEKTFSPGHGSKFSMLSGLSHDPLFRDIFIPLSTGGELHIPDQSDIFCPDHLYQWMLSSRIQYAHVTPQIIGLLATGKRKSSCLEDLRYIFSGGDVLSPATVRNAREIAPAAELVNFYGTSETPQAMAYQAVSSELQPPYPLGKPIQDVTIHILDDDLKPMAAGTAGEIVIETEYLSHGYLDDADNKTEQRMSYVRRLPGGQGKRAYLTGDIGYQDAEGQTYFCGRKDDQVKIRGYRVDCADVAATLERHGSTEQAVVLPMTGTDGKNFLMAFVTGNEHVIRNEAPTILPSYMVPRIIIHVDYFPLLPNGKIDRAALRGIGCDRLKWQGNKKENIENPLLHDIATALHALDFEADRSFVELGGDSLSSIQVSMLIEDYLGFLPHRWEKIPFQDIASMKSEKRLENNMFGLIKIQSTILFRAIGIMLVVLFHAGATTIFGTSTLFVVSGMSFSRMLLPGIINRGDIKPTIKFIIKFAMPAGLYELIRGLYFDNLWIPEIFLLGTFWKSPVSPHESLWFLDALSASILLLSFLAWCLSTISRKLNNVSTENLFLFSVFACGIAIFTLMAQITTGWHNGDLGGSVAPFRWFWMVAFGAAIETAETRIHKFLLTCVTAIIGILWVARLITDTGLKESLGEFFFISVVMLIWVDHIPIPRLFRRPIMLLAANSLFIYIVNYAVINTIMPRLGLPSWALLRVIAAIGCGFAAAFVWNRIVGGQHAGRA